MTWLGRPPPRFSPLERWRYLYIDRLCLLCVAVLVPLTVVQAATGGTAVLLAIAASTAVLVTTAIINRHGHLRVASWLMLGTCTVINWISAELLDTQVLIYSVLLVFGAAVLVGPRASLGLAGANLLWLGLRASEFEGAVDLATLIASVGGAAAFVSTMLTSIVDELESQRQALLAALERASTDGLTGLANHAALRQRLDEETARARRHHTALSLVMIDFDHFKGINDAHGHPVGDEVLRSMGKVLRSVAREGDTVARYGGEEFAAILPHTDGDGALRFAERVRAAVASMSLPVTATPIVVTASAGAASRHHDEDGAALLERADQALYAAKHGGRDRTVVSVQRLVNRAPAVCV